MGLRVCLSGCEGLLNLIIHPAVEKFLLISTGAVLGANARYWINDWASQKWGATFPYGTVLINISGSFLIGLFLTMTTERYLVDPRWRLLVAVGFLGAYTTFSTFSLESFHLFSRGQWFLGYLNAAGSTLIGILAAGLGALAGKFL